MPPHRIRFAMYHIESGPNPQASLDAAVAFSLLFRRHWRCASEPGRSARQ